MEHEYLFIFAFRVIFSFAATFLAILIWSRTRNGAWIFIIVGTIISYLDVFLVSMDKMGVIYFDKLIFGRYSLLQLVISILPYLFYSIGFALFLYHDYKIKKFNFTMPEKILKAKKESEARLQKVEKKSHKQEESKSNSDNTGKVSDNQPK